MTAAEPGGSVDDATFTEDALRIAGLAFDRVMTGVSPELDSMPPPLEPADALRWFGDRVTELVAGFAELPLDRFVDLGASVPSTTDRARDPAPRGEPLIMTATRGGLGEVRIWIHPLGRLPTGTLRFRLTDLHPDAGEPLPGGAAVFLPAEITAPRGATSAVLSYLVPVGVTPGRYDGLVLAHGVADAVVPLTVLIT